MSGITPPSRAHLKCLDTTWFRAICGRTSPDCPAELGFVIAKPKWTGDGLWEVMSEEEGLGLVETIMLKSLQWDAEPPNSPDALKLRYLMSHPFFLMEMLNEVRAGPLGEWVIYHPAGLRPTEDGAFAVIRGRRTKDGTRVGRRRVPETVEVNVRHPVSTSFRKRLIGSGQRAIIGQIPTLPVIIVCPVCARRNQVAPPDQR
ncbi:MAG: hypothetical protein M3Q75_04345 [Gemmatimonadota bacterium]|nr:hypothetical protein [Gemmatimonadota bacterium]